MTFNLPMDRAAPSAVRPTPRPPRTRGSDRRDILPPPPAPQPGRPPPADGSVTPRHGDPTALRRPEQHRSRAGHGAMRNTGALRACATPRSLAPPGAPHSGPRAVLRRCCRAQTAAALLSGAAGEDKTDAEPGPARNVF